MRCLSSISARCLPPGFVLGLCALTLSACGGSGSGGGADPAPGPQPASASYHLDLLSPRADTRYARGGVVPLRYSATVPAGATLNAYLDDDGDPDTASDRTLWRSDLEDPAGGERALVAPVRDRLNPFHIVLTLEREGQMLDAVVSGRITIGDVSFLHGNGGHRRGYADPFVAGAPDGSLVTTGDILTDGTLGVGSDAALVLPDGSPRRAWVASHDARGTPRWARQIEGGVYLTDLAVGAQGTIFVAGACNEDLWILGGEEPTLVKAYGRMTLFVLAFERDGTLRWANLVDTGAPEDGAVSIPQVRLAPRGTVGGVLVSTEAQGPVRVRPDRADERLFDTPHRRLHLVLGYDAQGALLAARQPRGGYPTMLFTDMAPTPTGGAVLAVAISGATLWSAADGDIEISSGDGTLRDIAYVRLDAIGRLDAFVVIPAPGSDAGLRSTAVTAHEDGSVTLAARLSLGDDFLFGEGTPGERLLREGETHVVVRFDANDIPQWTRVYDIDPGDEHLLPDTSMVALPDGGVLLAQNAISDVDVGAALPLVTDEQDVLRLLIAADGTLRRARLDGGPGHQALGDTAVGIDGSMFLTYQFGDEGIVVGNRSLMPIPYGALARLNADGL